MRLYIPVALGALLMGGCSSAIIHRPVGPVPISEGSVEAFSPLVPQSSAATRCKELGSSRMRPGERAVALVYADPVERQVTVTLDSDGVPTRYTDVRGDLSRSDDAAGDRTTIGLYFVGGYALISNRPSGAEPTMDEVPLADALSAEQLGNPRTTMEHVLATCG